jgi:serine acetyltransferase
MPIIKDIIANKGNLKSLLFVLTFRLSHFFTKNIFLKTTGFPFRLFYRIFSRNILHVEIWDSMEIGEGFVIWHGAQGSVINPYVKIGGNVSLRQNTTIGSSSFTVAKLAPQIGNNVQIGPNCVIVGKITIGNNVQIGAGAVVVNDIPDNTIVAGNPAKIIRIKNNDSE